MNSTKSVLKYVMILTVITLSVVFAASMDTTKADSATYYVNVPKSHVDSITCSISATDVYGGAQGILTVKNVAGETIYSDSFTMEIFTFIHPTFYMGYSIEIPINSDSDPGNFEVIWSVTLAAGDITGHNETASYTRLYYLTVSSAYGSVTGQTYYLDGQTAYAGMTAGEYSTGSYSKVVFAGWTLGGSSWGSNYAQSTGITMNSDKTIVANWDTYYQLLVSGGDSGTTGYNSGNWYKAGTSASSASNYVFSASGSQRSNLYRWRLDSGSWNYLTRTNTGTASTSSITMNAPHTVTWEAVTQYPLAYTGGNGITVGGTASQTGDLWYDSGTTSVTVSSNGVWGRNGGTGYRVASYNVNGGSNTAVATTDKVTVTLTMNSAKTVNFVSATQNQLTYSGGNNVQLSAPTISGDSGWYDSTASASISCDWIWSPSTNTRTALQNYQINGVNQNPTRQNTGTLTVTGISMNVPRTVTFFSVTQNKLTYSGGSGISFSTPSPTGDLYWDSSQSTTVSCSWTWNQVTNQTRTALTNVAIDGSNQNPTRQNSGTYTSSSLSMNAPHTVTFASVQQTYLAVNGGNGITYSTASPTGDNWYDSTQTVTVTSNWVYGESSGTRTALTGYIVDATVYSPNRQYSGTLTTVSISMSTYHTVTFTAVTQREVTIATSGVATDASGTVATLAGVSYSQSQLPASVWFDNGVNISYGFNSPITDGTTKRYLWASTSGLSQSAQSNTFTVSAAGTLTGTYNPQYLVTFVHSGLSSETANGTVVEVDGAPKAYAELPFSMWINSGDSVTFTWNSTVASTNPIITFLFSNSTQTSPYTVNAAATITGNYMAHYQSIGGDCDLNVDTLDMNQTLLSGTVVTLNGTQFNAAAGEFTITGLTSGDILTGSASWQGVTVNASFTITVTGNMTYEVICAVYPYIYGSTTYHCATDRNVSNTVWDGTHFGVGFQEADSAKTIVFTAPRIPTYIAGIAYDLDTAWNSSSQVFKATLPADTVILTVNFDNWGSGFYLQQISTPVSGVSWSGNALTFTFSDESTGSFTLRCGSRGLPAATTGLSAPAYDAATTFFTALYTSRTALTLDWTQQGGSGGGGGGGSSGGGSPSGGAFTLLVEPNFGTYYRGSNGTATLTLKFSGTPNFNVLSVIISGDGRSFIQPVTPPTSPLYSGTGTLTLDLNIPSNAAPGAYTVTVVVSGLDANGIQRSATAQATLTVASETQSGGEPISGVPQNMVQIVAVVIILAAVSVAALAIITRRQ